MCHCISKNVSLRQRHGLRRWLAAAASLFPIVIIGGCGFHPLYARRNAESLALIHIHPIEDRIGQILRNALIDRMTPHGLPAEPHYALSIKLNLSTQSLYTETLNSIVLIATYSLKDLKRNKHPVIFTGTVRTMTSYHSHDAPYAIIGAERAAQSQAAYQLADEIVDSTALYFTNTRAMSLRKFEHAKR